MAPRQFRTQWRAGAVSEKDDSYIEEIDQELARIYEGEIAANDPGEVDSDREWFDEELADGIDEEPMGLFDWILAGIALVFIGAWKLASFALRFGIPILFIVGIVGAITGWFDRKEAVEDLGNPGAPIVRELKRSGAIEDFKAVEPDEGWQWQYELDPTADLRFRERGDDAEMEYRSSDRDLEKEIEKVAEREGFVFEPE